MAEKDSQHAGLRISAEKLDFIIGSDGSDDGTGAVITAMAATNPNIQIIINAERKERQPCSTNSYQGQRRYTGCN
ncbi:MAG: hypothetical protein IPI37_00025 [Bacteroidales bacterium]|nr:hypothetical protein [Bacteroidales bacterium]